MASMAVYEASVGCSRAVVVGDRIVTSGTAPIWADGSCDPDVTVQARRCIEIILAGLAEGGATSADVIRTRIYLADAKDLDAVSRGDQARRAA
jgi:enamine deaminase RidA (YjgF/YER057c/UK114 family)